MEPSFGALIFLLIFFVLFFFIGVLITRWIFGIPKIIKQLEHQTANLSVMRHVINVLAEKQGMSKQEIKNIMDKVNSEM